MSNFVPPTYPPSDPYPCPNCEGSGKDPRKRTRKCPQCFGKGSVEVCKVCGEVQPCDCVDQSVLY